MRYSLLNFLACPETRSELICVVLQETPGLMVHSILSDCVRINFPGTQVAPMPANVKATHVVDLLWPMQSAPAPAPRNYEVRIKEGILIAPDTGRWYPIREFVPELLPDYLRDFDRDYEWLASQQTLMPAGLYDALLDRKRFANASKAKEDAGISHKESEMRITEKITDPGFFIPGTISPFNPSSTEHTSHLIRLFSFCWPLLGNGTRRVVLDSGCGYAWTTEWMLRAGMEPIGIDISRVYIDVANSRLGNQLPYVVVGDAEKLPIRDEVLEGVLGFDAFHHVPNRNRAMHEFFRTMKENGVIVLAEPPEAHEHVPYVKDVMDKYGILEKGMELRDVREYVKGTGLEDPVQHFILRVQHDQVRGKVTKEFLRQSSFNPANLFTIEKKASLLNRIKRAFSN